jgi:ABC-2 type transport system ATP-binding protein
MLLGLTEPSGGSSRVVGLDPTRHPLEVKRQVGYLPDSVGFYGNMTGRENLRYTARLNGLGGTEAEDHIAAVLEQVGLTDRADGRTDTYSRGMLQRLGIADALTRIPASSSSTSPPRRSAVGSSRSDSAPSGSGHDDPPLEPPARPGADGV